MLKTPSGMHEGERTNSYSASIAGSNSKTWRATRSEWITPARGAGEGHERHAGDRTEERCASNPAADRRSEGEGAAARKRWGSRGAAGWAVVDAAEGRQLLPPLQSAVGDAGAGVSGAGSAEPPRLGSNTPSQQPPSGHPHSLTPPAVTRADVNGRAGGVARPRAAAGGGGSPAVAPVQATRGDEIAEAERKREQILMKKALVGWHADDAEACVGEEEESLCRRKSKDCLIDGLCLCESVCARARASSECVQRETLYD